MKTRISVLALVAALLLAPAAPSGAQSLPSLRQRRDAARSHKAQLAAKIDALKASDAQLADAVRVLDAQVNAQANAAEAASQAALAAQSSLAAAANRLSATEARIDGVRGAIAERAIDAYMRPSEDQVTAILQAHDLGEASRRQTLLAHVLNDDAEVLDQLRALQEDERIERAALAKARDVARQRLQASADRLRDLGQARAGQARVRSALDARIADYTAEADALGKEQSAVESLIQAKEAAARAANGGNDNFNPGAVSGVGLIWPVHGPVTSEFGPRWGGFHPGIDIAPGYGTPIHAAKAGIVIYAGWENGYGNFVIIDHGGGFATAYGHQSRIAVTDGQQVAQGQVIGYVGSTGHSTGPHLHFETRVNGAVQNPRRYLP